MIARLAVLLLAFAAVPARTAEPPLFTLEDLTFLTHMIMHHEQALDMCAMVASRSKREDFIRFEKAVKEQDEVVECHLVSGGYDYLLKVMARGVNHYQELMEGLLERNVGIEKYFSYIVIKSPFIKTHYPIEKVFGGKV